MLDEKKPLVTNAANEDQVREAKQKVESLRDQQLNDIRFVMSHPQGRRLMGRIIFDQFKVMGTVFVPGDPHHTSYYSGRQDAGHFLMSEILQADTDGYLKMMMERKPEEKKK